MLSPQRQVFTVKITGYLLLAAIHEPGLNVLNYILPRAELIEGARVRHGSFSN